MGESKVQNYYFGPNLDPAKIPSAEYNTQKQSRPMLSTSICCHACGNYMTGTQLNSRKCTACSAELRKKTSPQNSDYTFQFGATRNFEPRRENQELNNLKRKNADVSADELARSIKARHAKVNAMFESVQRNAKKAEKAPKPKEKIKLKPKDEAFLKSLFGGRQEEVVPSVPSIPVKEYQPATRAPRRKIALDYRKR